MQLKLNFKNTSVAFVGLFFIWLLYALWRTKDAKIVDLVNIDLKELISYSILAAERGGYAVERIYNERKLFIQSKGKTAEGAEEVLTQADVISHLLIYETLQRLPGIREKIVSEESAARLLSNDLEQYKLNNYDVWLSNQRAVKDIPSISVPLSSVTIWVDPLDATQEFTEGLREYVSVMICIAVDGKPKFGIIHRPFLRDTVWGLIGYGTHPKLRRANTASQASGPTAENASSNVVVVSRSHSGAVRQLLEKAGSFGPRSKFVIEPAGGSGYKTLRVLNGTAFAYVHSTAIKKWDLCAADAVIRAAGGRITTLNGDDITYFSKNDVLVDKGILVTLNEHFEFLAQLKNAAKPSVVHSDSA